MGINRVRRVTISANGNLQRISEYYYDINNSPFVYKITYNIIKEENNIITEQADNEIKQFDEKGYNIFEDFV